MAGIYKIKRFSKQKGIVSPITYSGKYKGGSENLLNLADDFIKRKQNKIDYLRKLGVQEISRSADQCATRFSKPVQIGKFIEGFGKFSYKNGKRLIR